MEENTSTKKTFSIDGCTRSAVLMNVLGAIFWLFPLLCRRWLSISPEMFYAKYTAVFMIQATWPIIQSISLLYHAKRKKDISISRGMMADIWMILATNTFALLFVTIANGVIEANVKISSDSYQQLGEFIFRYGGIYVAAMLLSALFGIAAIRRTKKGEGKVLDAEK